MCQNMVEYVSIFNSDRVLNMSDTTDGARSLFDKHFDKNTRKRGPPRKHFGFVSPRYS